MVCLCLIYSFRQPLSSCFLLLSRSRIIRYSSQFARQPPLWSTKGRGRQQAEEAVLRAGDAVEILGVAAWDWASMQAEYLCLKKAFV
ncbi:hypothetical protein FGO68_gene12912 [Halteria grandinella]|uniref:Uncharacterized protein n=1 Tax=Halteria grandinella TaxID=5974 RepID=A0A8J8T0X8_HALGN|nr:hypothetical protein FGO68_gene12912 [Halteria grandinella]